MSGLIRAYRYPPSRAGQRYLYASQDRQKEARSTNPAAKPSSERLLGRTRPVNERARPTSAPAAKEAPRVPNPFGSSVADGAEEPAHPMQGGGAKPWGLSEEDRQTIDSLTDPSAGDGSVVRKVARDDRRLASRHGGRISASAQPSKTPETSNNTEIEAAGPQPIKLTHVKSTGEAHMVDVGHKDSTKRIAIALGHVRFSNPDTLKLIEENTNKKGDVLGVARIAGIMASKRAADIIPLCHPIAISKVEVDLSLVPAREPYAYWKGIYGAVMLQARVECVGPTGVEMEAMTAIHAAMLTVYDMCKAVDKRMDTRSLVVFKTGGRSGTWSDSHWRDSVSGRFFESQTADIGHLLGPKKQSA